MFVYADPINRDGATKRRFIVVPEKNVPLLKKSVLKPKGKSTQMRDYKSASYDGQTCRNFDYTTETDFQYLKKISTSEKKYPHLEKIFFLRLSSIFSALWRLNSQFDLICWLRTL